jgi:CRISPR-associated protein Cas8b1/Cst1 subtype I-B
MENKINSSIKLTNNVTVNMLLFADDMVILQDNVQKNMYELQKLSNIYNFKVSTTKTKVMAFRGKYQIR